VAGGVEGIAGYTDGHLRWANAAGPVQPAVWWSDLGWSDGLCCMARATQLVVYHYCLPGDGVLTPAACTQVAHLRLQLAA
jgi:hypothetical protein